MQKLKHQDYPEITAIAKSKIAVKEETKIKQTHLF